MHAYVMQCIFTMHAEQAQVPAIILNLSHLAGSAWSKFKVSIIDYSPSCSRTCGARIKEDAVTVCV